MGGIAGITGPQSTIDSVMSNQGPTYRDRNRKIITLPSGAKCVIRKLTVSDFISIGGIPSVLPDDVKAGTRKPTEKEQQEMNERGLAIQRVIFTKCMGPIVHEGKRYFIVDKPVGQAADGEIEIDAWDQSDAEFVALEVMSFSGMRKGVAGNGDTFRADPSGHGEPASTSQNLPQAAERTTETTNQ